jgi:hypothetical protein
MHGSDHKYHLYRSSLQLLAIPTQIATRTAPDLARACTRGSTKAHDAASEGAHAIAAERGTITTRAAATATASPWTSSAASSRSTKGGST